MGNINFKIKSNKGVTLVILIITIIVLGMISGIFAFIITGKFDIFDKAKKAKNIESITRLETEANNVYLDLKINPTTNTYSEEEILDNVINILDNKGYEIYKKSINTSNMITGINLESDVIRMKPGDSEKITVNYETSDYLYYAIIDDKYYKIDLIDNEIIVDKNSSVILSSTGNDSILNARVKETNTGISVNYINGNNVIINASNNAKGTATLLISYGDYIKECKVVVINENNSYITIKMYGNNGEIWTNTDVSAELEISGMELGSNSLMYKIGENDTWKIYDAENKISVTENNKIFAAIYDGINYNNIVNGEVTNIDKVDPIINKEITKVNSTTNSAEVEIKVTDEDSGLGKIVWYYKKVSDTNWKNETDVYQKSGSLSGNITEQVKRHIYRNLDQATEYEFYAEVYDVAGNKKLSKSESEPIKVTTKTVTALVDGTNITFDYSTLDWTNLNVTATLNVEETTIGQYKLRYKINENGQWNDYDSINKIKVTSNDIIYAALFDGTNYGVSATGRVNNIDRLAPVINVELAEKSSGTNNIVVTMKITDADSGLGKIIVYYKKVSDTNWLNKTEILQSPGVTAGVTTQQTKDYSFTGLSQTTEYEFYAEVYDVAGNKVTSYSSENSLKISTGTVTALTTSNITFGYSTSNWTNENVVVTLTVADNIKGSNILRYKIGSEGTWNDYNSTNKITLTSNNTIYAALFDGTNYGISATGSVTKIDKTKPTIGSVTGTTATGNSGTVKVATIADTGGSGLKGIYISAVNTSTAPTVNSSWTSNTSASYNKTVTTNGTYYVWVIDNANNISDVKSCAVSGIVAKVSISSYANATIVAGNSATPKLTYTGTAKSKAFKSSATGVATVDANGKVTAVAAGTATITATLTNYDGTTATKTCTVTVQASKAKIGSTNYNSLASAVSVGGSITLLANVTENITVASGKTVTLNLNSKTITGKITNNGTLSMSSGTVKDNGSSPTIYHVAGTTTLTSVTVTSTQGNTIRMDAGTVTVKSGTITTTGPGDGTHPIWVNGGTLNVEGGTIQYKGSSKACESIDAENGSRINIKGGTVTNAVGGRAIITNGSIYITGGTISNNSTTTGYATVRIGTGGTFSFTKGTIKNSNTSGYTYQNDVNSQNHAGGTWTK